MHYCLLAVLIFLLPTSGFAKDSDYEKAMARGQAYFESKDYRAAIQEFRSALLERPDNPTATYSLGASLSRSKDPAAESELKQALRLDPSNPAVTLELGNHYLARGVLSEARDYFEETLRLSPKGEPGVLARKGLDLVNSQTIVKKWGVSLLTGLQYDSNVPLTPEGEQLITNVEPKDDARGVLNLGLTWTPVKTSQFEVATGYSLYQNLHTRLDGFDLSQNQVSLSTKYHLSPAVLLAAGYGFDYLTLGGDGYAANHSITPSIEFSFSKGYQTTAFYKYRNTSYKDSPLFTLNSERSGEAHQVGVNQKAALSDTITVRLSYYFETEKAEKNYWDNKAHQLLGGVTVGLPWNMVADLTAEGGFSHYAAPIPTVAGAITRDDRNWTTAVVLSRQFSKYFSLIAGWRLTRNYSNIAIDDYSRNITTLMGRVRF